MGFNKTYFKTLYGRGETIDGDFNAKDHAKYLKSLFELQGFHPSSIYDFGFGKGNLLKEVSRKLECTNMGGCDISQFAFDQLRQKPWSKDWKLELCEIHNLKTPKKPYHLGLSNSVLQYLDKNKVEKSIRKMADSCKYVYFHVPTKEDYKILKADLDFDDSYALKRSNIFYLKILSKYFCFVSWGLLESKKFTQHKNSVFTDSLYRF